MYETSFAPATNKGKAIAQIQSLLAARNIVPTELEYQNTNGFVKIGPANKGGQYQDVRKAIADGKGWKFLFVDDYEFAHLTQTGELSLCGTLLVDPVAMTLTCQAGAAFDVAPEGGFSPGLVLSELIGIPIALHNVGFADMVEGTPLTGLGGVFRIKNCTSTVMTLEGVPGLDAGATLGSAPAGDVGFNFWNSANSQINPLSDFFLPQNEDVVFRGLHQGIHIEMGGPQGYSNVMRTTRKLDTTGLNNLSFGGNIIGTINPFLAGDDQLVVSGTGSFETHPGLKVGDAIQLSGNSALGLSRAYLQFTIASIAGLTLTLNETLPSWLAQPIAPGDVYIVPSEYFGTGSIAFENAWFDGTTAEFLYNTPGGFGGCCYPAIYVRDCNLTGEGDNPCIGETATFNLDLNISVLEFNRCYINTMSSFDAHAFTKIIDSTFGPLFTSSDFDMGSRVIRCYFEDGADNLGATVYEECNFPLSMSFTYGGVFDRCTVRGSGLPVTLLQAGALSGAPVNGLKLSNSGDRMVFSGGLVTTFVAGKQDVIAGNTAGTAFSLSSVPYPGTPGSTNGILSILGIGAGGVVEFKNNIASVNGFGAFTLSADTTGYTLVVTYSPMS